MGSIILLILLALEIEQYGLAEGNISERNGRFILELSCDNFQEYKDLSNLQTSHTCTGSNEVWAILERLQRYGPNGLSCMHQVINQLGQAFHNCCATPSHCSCSGINELAYYQVRSDLADNIAQCWQGPYAQLFNGYFYDHKSSIHQNPPRCHSHHTVWTLLAGISSYNCRLDIILHIADKYHRLPNNCSCHTNTGSGLQQGTFTASITPTVTVPSDHCLQYESYRYLENLRLHPEMCVSVNNMWSYLADIHGKNDQCRRRILDNMSYTFKEYRQFEQHCVCTGHDIHHNTVNLPNLDQDHCRSHHTHYRYFHDVMYAHSPSPCRSHQYMWTYFNEISFDRFRDCKVDFILHAAATYPDARKDPCSCYSDSLSTQTSKHSTIITTPMTKTIVITATVATMPSTNHTFDVNTTPDVLHTHHICNKASTIADVALNLTIHHPNATDCTAGDHASAEAFVLSNCNVGSATMWIKGENVMDMCHKIPLYTPIATFDASGVYRPNGGMAGIFLGCIQDGFKIAAQNCNHGVSIQHITDGGIFQKISSSFYIIKW